MARRMKWKECDVHALALTQQSYSSRHSGSESSSDTSSCGSSAVSHNSSGSSEQGGNPNDFEPLSWESQTFDPAHYGSRFRDADSDQAVWNNPNLEAAINAEQNKRNEDNEDDASDEDDASAKPSEQDLKKLTVINLRKQLKERGLKTGGNKGDLIDRLLDYYDTDATSTESKQLMNKKQKQLRQLLEKRGLKTGGNKADMVDRLLGREVTKKRKVAWKKSQGRALLKKLSLDKKSYVHGKTAEEVHKSHEWFEEFPLDKFKEYFTDMLASAAQHRAIVAEDNRLVNLEYTLIPRKSMTSRGYPFWRNHAASTLLREEIERESNDGKRGPLKPKDWRETKEEYRKFPPEVFRQHIYQERRRAKERPMKQAQRNKKGKKNHDEQVKKSHQDWEKIAGDGEVEKVFDALKKMTIREDVEDD